MLNKSTKINRVLELFLLVVTVLGVLTSREVSVYSKTGYEILFIMILNWLIYSSLTETYYPKFSQRKYKYVIAPYIKFVFLFVISSWLMIHLFFSPGYYKSVFYLNIVIFPFALFVLYSVIILFYTITRKDNTGEIQQVNKYEQKELSSAYSFKPGLIDLAVLKKSAFIKKNIVNSFIHEFDSNRLSKSNLIKDYNNLEGLNIGSDVIIADILLNKVKDLKTFFNKVYEKLIAGGYAIFVFEELETFEKRFINNSNIQKILYYIFYRSLPKIPFVNILYNLFRGVKYKVISKSEIWGRLVYSGFDIVQHKDYENLSFILVKKFYEPSVNPNPSFYPVISLNRVGYAGKIIQIHKVRSMYPYSEFIQKQVFEQNNISSIGKFENDFRITKPGKFFRKYWIDELPQLYDWFRGEIKLVGIRAMSQHFFSLYPKVYQELFTKVKPGIISPIFENVDFKDIVRIEQEYLESYLKNPMLTDLKYFYKTIKQIFSGVRSN